MTDILKKLIVLRMPGIGPAKFNGLVKKFDSLDAVIDVLNPDQEHIDNVKREMDLANQHNIKYVSDDMKEYPDNLRAMKNHPPVICVRGNIDVLQQAIVAMVGTRHATAHGMEFMAKLAESFAEHNIAVASGMAIGTDTAVHRGALRAGKTIAVLAGGADYIWPTENESLYWEIVERGAVVSEMPVGFVPVANNFVMRNRIVAGLADKLILGEADEKSGSMTTARFAIENNRTVYAVPSHPSDARAIGPNSLIKSGQAILCSGAQDFFQIDKKSSVKKNFVGKNESENSILDKLGFVPVSESVLTEIVKKSISEIKSELVILEMQGLVRKIDGGYVRV